MKQLLTSVVREICTLRSVGAGVRATVPGHPVVMGNHDSYSDFSELGAIAIASLLRSREPTLL